MIAILRGILKAISGNHGLPPPGPPPPPPPPEKKKRTPQELYFSYLAESNKHLSLRGLLHGHIPKIRLDEIYISLKAVAGDAGERAGLAAAGASQPDDGSDGVAVTE